MDFPIHIDAISMGLSILHFLGVKARIFLILVCFCLWKFVVILANSADPDEMQHSALFFCFTGSSLFAKVPI